MLDFVGRKDINENTVCGLDTLCEKELLFDDGNFIDLICEDLPQTTYGFVDIKCYQRNGILLIRKFCGTSK